MNRQLLKAGVREWVVIHFPVGTVAVGAKGDQLAQGSVNVPQAKIAGTVGAGDAFAAGVLLGLHEKAPMELALKYGVCAAAASLSDPTTSRGVCLSRILVMTNSWMPNRENFASDAPARFREEYL